MLKILPTKITFKCIELNKLKLGLVTQSLINMFFEYVWRTICMNNVLNTILLQYYLLIHVSNVLKIISFFLFYNHNGHFAFTFHSFSSIFLCAFLGFYREKKNAFFFYGENCNHNSLAFLTMNIG